MTEETTLQFIMLCGIPGSGKSTWTKNFLSDKHREHWQVVSSDQLIEEYASANDLTYNEAFPEKVKEATKFMKLQLQEAILQKKNIIWDQTNLQANSRMKKLKSIPDYYVKTAIAFEIPEDLEDRLYNRSRKYINSSLVETMKSVYTFPEEIEGFDEVKIINV